MLRKVAVGLAAIGALSAAQVRALGLGDVTVHSALNQPLNAEIELLQVRDLTSSQIIAGLADADEFYLAGVKPTAVLSDLSFELKLSGNGGKLILRTREPIREPFLNFLVEVNWPSGRLVKEYTLLLDPPVFSAQDLAPRTRPSAPVSRASVPAAPAPAAARPAVIPPAPAATGAMEKAASSAAPGTYFVGKNDTLWNIALKTRPDRSVSPQRMMVAIQRANPDAFIGGNINRLKSGVVLNIPTAEEIAALDREAALADVRRQNAAWKSSAAPAKKPTADKPRPEPRLATDKPAAEAQEAAPEKSQLRIVSKETSDSAQPEKERVAGSNTAESDIGKELLERNKELEEQLVVTLEGLDKVERDNAELFARLERLSEQMESMQRLLQLKDEQLAQMQQRLAEAQMAASAAAVQQAPESSGDDLMKTLTSLPVLGGIAAGLIALLGGAFWFVRKRRRDAEAEEQAVQEALAALEAEEQKEEKKPEAPVAEAAVAAAAAATADALAGEGDDEIGVEADPDDPFNAVGEVKEGELDALADIDVENDLDMDLKLDEPVADDVDLDEFAESLLSDDEFDLAVESEAGEPQAGAGEGEEQQAAAEDEQQAAAELEDDLEAILAEGSAQESEAQPDELDALLAGGDEDETELDAVLTGEGEEQDELDALLDSGDDEAAEPEAEDADDVVPEGDLDAILAAAAPEEAAPAEEPELPVDDEIEPALADDAEAELDRLLAEEQQGDGVDEVDPLAAELESLIEEEDAKAEALDLETVAPADDEEVEEDDTLKALFDMEEDESADSTKDESGAADAEVLDADELLSSLTLEEDIPAEPEGSADASLMLEDDDLELSELPADEADSEAERKPAPVVGLEDDDLSLEPAEALEEAEQKAEELLDGLPEADEEEADLDALLAELGVDDVDTDTDEGAESPAAAEPGAGLELDTDFDSLDDEDLEATLGKVLEEEGDGLTLEESAVEDGLDYLEGADEVATKLDLARAYIDMDDVDGATDILAEVLREGNEEQKAEAQSMLDSLKS